MFPLAAYLSEFPVADEAAERELAEKAAYEDAEFEARVAQTAWLHPGLTPRGEADTPPTATRQAKGEGRGQGSRAARPRSGLALTPTIAGYALAWGAGRGFLPAPHARAYPAMVGVKAKPLRGRAAREP